VSNYWSVRLPHLLKPDGTLAPLTGRALKLAKHWTEIVAQASNYDEPTTLRCRAAAGASKVVGGAGRLNCVLN
jgi:hypothetical protein